MKGSENLKKCDYCAKEISYFEQYCSEECHGNANKYYETTEKYGKLFSIINMICFFGIPIGIFLFAFLRTAGMIITVASCDILGVMLSHRKYDFKVQAEKSNENYPYYRTCRNRPRIYVFNLYVIVPDYFP